MPQHQYKYSVDSSSMSKGTTPLIESKVNRMPTVYFSDYAWAQLWTIINYCKDEVGWYGLVDETQGGDYIIAEIFVPEQKVSAATTDIESEAMGKLAAELEAAGKDSSKLRYWGHSHVNMSVRPSGTDEDQIQEYLDHVDWFIRGIHNKKGDSKVDVYDVENNVVHQCVNSMRIPAFLSDEDKTALVKEVDLNVTKKYQVPQHPHHLRGNVREIGKGKAMTPSQVNQQVIEEDEWDYGYGYNYYGEHYSENFQKGEPGKNDPNSPKN